ncbi:phosphoribosylformylglycinamidine synthase [Gardnerella swidsinskii]|uniref:Phosphoribosylformylglycinamidine synthase n=1 Tax=Gardnerella swidsinskii TaxID=2792979 RepID=A0A9X7FED6_9BIFI|nr:phosphoribosylformylglycinamidine synthase [Gardnerella swidsinskii]NSX41123.1 phosphoribosylformylglycinamidine synthase [Gardnerella vaginalis]PMC54583.1 phosphoribosylformylglycinamidine synthase [Gardnerella swidsinskii]
MVFRVYVEKRTGFDVQAQQLLHELREILGISAITSARIINRYDVEGISKDLFDNAVQTVLSEPPVDNTYDYLPIETDEHVFAVEFLPGQFDQRAQSASECIQLISQGERPTVRTARVIALKGNLDEKALNDIKHYVINPVEAREASLDEVKSLQREAVVPSDVEVISSFNDLDEAGLQDFINTRGLAMDLADAKFCQKYFCEEHRNPTITEIRVIDTYWSDHCRHTTFGTELTDISIDDNTVQEAFSRYLDLRKELNRENKPICLMDMATIGAKYLKHTGELKNLDESEEINACTVKVKVDVNGHDEDWLFLFKNETHNHPTEIEPFGGAATCIGGCIRDPLSGRSYVYQAMRVTGAADPRTPISETLNGKLPQRKIVTSAAAGYSSYGNQIGLATGEVHELYHPGYVAKRMEVGAVVAATPADHVRRETPAPGDVIILLGGRTGRDGIGGATGASKAQDVESIEECGAEVQKGNAPIERKLQRLFRRKDACQLIKRCNDFGAGGISVATGEIADSLTINLDKVSKKYEGLDGTELAISESQERMAVDVASSDAEEFLKYAREENLEAEIIATVTEEARMRMTWRGKTIVDLSRAFLASNGAAKQQILHIESGESYETPWQHQSDLPLEKRMHNLVSDINIASNKGLSERFDSTIGAATVLMPFGGRRQLTPAQAMVAKFPVFGETNTTSAMAWGFNPYLMEKNQFTGAYVAVVESLAKLAASGFTRERAYLSLQEYFGKPHDIPERWGKPAAAVLGALSAQLDFGVGAIGGKDSMSGSFENLDVPPTLISFAVSTGDARLTVSPEFKGVNHKVIRIAPKYKSDGITPEKESFLKALEIVENITKNKQALAISTPGYGASAESLFKMTLGNHIGLKLFNNLSDDDLFKLAYGSFYVELKEDAEVPSLANTSLVDVELVGETTENYAITSSNGEEIDLSDLQKVWESALSSIFPYKKPGEIVETINSETNVSTTNRMHTGKLKPLSHPRVIIPVFPGNNCEYDTQAAFEKAGADAHTLIINNLSAKDIARSAERLVEEIKKSQIVMIPGGFSGGDEPDGSAKFITAFFRNPAVTDAVRDLLNNRDGLMLGICNGFQALIKLGLVPFGDIIPINSECPTLTYNTIGRHQSRIVRTRVASNLSPWLANTQVGDMHTVAISHGEGRFIATPEVMEKLINNGQVATQYVDSNGVPSMSLNVNPNGSIMSVEGITSPDGRVFGKMGHCERAGRDLYVNIPDFHEQPLFEAGVEYFTA